MQKAEHAHGFTMFHPFFIAFQSFRSSGVHGRRQGLEAGFFRDVHVASMDTYLMLG